MRPLNTNESIKYLTNESNGQRKMKWDDYSSRIQNSTRSTYTITHTANTLVFSVLFCSTTALHKRDEATRQLTIKNGTPANGQAETEKKRIQKRNIPNSTIHTQLFICWTIELCGKNVNATQKIYKNYWKQSNCVLFWIFFVFYNCL